MNASLGVFLLSFVSTVYGESITRVVNGTNAPDEKYTYMVAIKYPGVNGDINYCGGSILNKRYVLTAANCIVDEFPNVLKVKYGKNVWNDTSIGWSEVEELIPHENYFNFEDDIGLIKLKNEIVFNKNVQPVKLPTSDNIDSKFTAVAIGWGILRNGSYPNDLQQIALNVISHRECVERITDVSRHQICTYQYGGGGVCFGDLGGPLVAGNYQIGIASYTELCASVFPDVFTRVYSYLDWIEEHSRL